MKFITERDLREQFNNASFTEYEADPDVRLTPGARQFLIDRGIDLYHGEEEPCGRPLAAGKKTEKGDKGMDPKSSSLRAFMLESILEIAQIDQNAAEKLRNLYAWTSSRLDGKMDDSTSICLPCNGMNPLTYEQLLPDCFPVEESNEIPLAQFKIVLRLHRIRCMAREMKPNPTINQTINGLSQLICATLGGGKCKNK